MFIDITKLEIKENIPVPLYIHKELVKRFMGENPKEEFTPEIMMEYLKHTNIVANVRDMLSLIPEGKEAEFKEAVLSAVERRKVAPINIPRIREIAERGNFSEELEETHKLEKCVPHTAQNHRVFIAKSNKDLANNPDLTKYDMVICDFEGYTRFADLTKLCKHMIIKGDIDWRRRYFEKLPDLSESIVYGYFNCNSCENLESLEGAPEKVYGDFSCWYCKNLTSLEGAPKEVGRNFNCSGCYNLTSLEGAPKEVGGNFWCYDCKNLTSLKGAPEKVVGFLYCNDSSRYLIQDGQYYDLFNLPKDKEFVINGDLDLSYYSFGQLPDLTNVVVKGDFDCRGCENLTSLKGAPKEVSGYFDCGRCLSLTSLKEAPEKVGGGFSCRCTAITSLDGAPQEVGGVFDCHGCKNLTSAEGLPTHIGGKIECDNKFRPEIDKELEKREKDKDKNKNKKESPNIASNIFSRIFNKGK